MKNLYLFDCFGVLLSSCAYKFFVAHYGEEDAYDAFSYFFEGTNIGNRTFAEAVDMISKDLGIGTKEILYEWTKDLKINYELLNTIKELRKTGKTVLLSNAASGLVESMMKDNNINLDEYFDKVFISADYHMEKPDLKFFLLAVNSFKNEKFDRITMVDDSKTNLKNLPSIGIEPILMTNNEEVISKLIKTNK